MIQRPWPKTNRDKIPDREGTRRNADVNGERTASSGWGGEKKSLIDFAYPQKLTVSIKWKDEGNDAHT